MVATTVKKELDVIFANEDPKKRFYSISRCEEDGSLMAIMSLAAGGKVRLVSRLPLVNNEFGAALPRLSKWGFCEGDYQHRAIDRSRMFWDTHVVPTSDYRFGNPLSPMPTPAADWPSLPEPPLPGRHDPSALLPIWSSIDGQSVTWPWWYRILNLVLQPLYLQPGATATDVYTHCAEHSTELFEVELVLDWLESINAVSRTIGGGYRVTANFWAAFGDRLLDSENDWFGDQLKRTKKMTTKQRWRDEYNFRYSAMQKHGAQAFAASSRRQEQVPSHARGQTVGQQIARNSKAQYRILQQALLEPAPQAEEEMVVEQGDQVPTPVADAVEQNQTSATEVTELLSPAPRTSVQEENAEVVQTPSNEVPLNQEVEMVDADAEMDAGDEDEDAEGEMDDTM